MNLPARVEPCPPDAKVWPGKVVSAAPLSLQQQDVLRGRLAELGKTHPGRAVAGWLLFFYGARLPDLAALRVKDVFDDAFNVRREFTLRRAQDGRFRKLMMAPELAASLEDWILQRPKFMQAETFILASQVRASSPLSRWQILRNLSPVMDGLGCEKGSYVVVLRRTAVWNFHVQCGCNLAETARWLGQSVINTSALLWPQATASDVLQPKNLGVAEREHIMSLFETENVALNQRVRELTARVESLAVENLGLKAALAQKLARQSLAEIAQPVIPGRLVDFPAAVEREYRGKIVFHNAAIQSLKDSPFLEVGDAWAVFKMLGNEFFTHYAGEPWALVQAALDQHRAYYQHSVGSRAVGSFEGYRRQYNGRTWELGRHLCIGNSRDPQRCFRVYFDWDEQSKQIVIFHAGRHLDCSQT
jgi:hypothetical protein